MAEVPKQKFFYKQVAVVAGRFFSIFDGKSEFVVGETMHEQAKAGHAGGFYVYRTPEEALFADVCDIFSPAREGGLFIAPRTVLKVMAWGDCVEYPNGKLSFSYLCPVFNVGLPRGYLATKYLPDRAAKRLASRIKQPSPGTRRIMDLPYWEKLNPPMAVRANPALGRLRKDRGIVSVKRSMDSPAVIIKSVRNYRVTQSVPRRRKLSPVSYRAKLERMQDETKKLEQEVEEMEKRAALLQLEEDLDQTDSVDMTPAIRGRE